MDDKSAIVESNIEVLYLIFQRIDEFCLYLKSKNCSKENRRSILSIKNSLQEEFNTALKQQLVNLKYLEDFLNKIYNHIIPLFNQLNAVKEVGCNARLKQLITCLELLQNDIIENQSSDTLSIAL